jgi:hypothetical protein
MARRMEGDKYVKRVDAGAKQREGVLGTVGRLFAGLRRVLAGRARGGDRWC